MSDGNKNYKKCQSCALAINNDKNRGTNEDGTLSAKYCWHCYKNGQFTQPNINCDEMQQISFSFFKKQHPIKAFFFRKSYFKAIAKLSRWTDKNK
ncbi:zinc ribbon domain-containing protein [Spiroplasma attinicola]|uniref:zinc ribbon domain-containing protein n=1 Tax=Spiroplasma attinicola TaxID=2904537 RepID=UPI002022A2CF|nr:zinc ribbon domain-containing protein [Spiroplasma sp. JKS002670]MCL8209500.1 hypothetical protein [Spiroplasma sp. JKS002670]